MKTFNLILSLSFAIFFQVSLAQESVYESAGHKFKIEVLSEQKDAVWGFDFVDAKTLIFTERGGAIRTFDLTSKKISDVKGAPAVWAKGQGGMLDIRVNPDKAGQIFITYSEPREKDKAATALAVGTLVKNELTQFKTIFSMNTANDETIHFGSRIEFDRKGHVFMTIGDRDDRPKVQDLKFHNGKLLRLNLDGTIPADNPFRKDKNAAPEIWSYGHRSPQGLAMSKDGSLWEAEMGPRGGDELNLIKPGENYGWPQVTLGREYSGFPLGVKEKKGMTSAVAHWVPSISPSAIAVYDGDKFPGWKGNIFMGCLSGTHLRRLEIVNNQVVKQEPLLEKLGQRFRNLRTGPEGFLYFSTDGGQIARIVPVK